MTTVFVCEDPRPPEADPGALIDPWPASDIHLGPVPEDVRNELAARAARERKSMQEYLREKLEQLARKPTIDRWLEAVQERKALSGQKVSDDTILGHRDADRR